MHRHAAWRRGPGAYTRPAAPMRAAAAPLTSPPPRRSPSPAAPCSFARGSVPKRDVRSGLCTDIFDTMISLPIKRYGTALRPLFWGFLCQMPIGDAPFRPTVIMAGPRVRPVPSPPGSFLPGVDCS